MKTRIASNWRQKTLRRVLPLLCALVVQPLGLRNSAQAQTTPLNSLEPRLGIAHGGDDAVKAKVVLLKEGDDGELEDAAQKIGGQVWAGVQFDVEKGAKFSSGLESVTLRLREEPDQALGNDQHPANENHVDVVLPLTPAGTNPAMPDDSDNSDDQETFFKWQKRTGNGEWSDTSEAFSTPNTGESTVSYRVSWGWKTTKTWKTPQNAQDQTKLYDHNGDHTIFPVAVNEDKSRVGAFIQMTKSDDGNTDTAQKKPDVENLVITDVSTSNGTLDYFKAKFN